MVPMAVRVAVDTADGDMPHQAVFLKLEFHAQLRLKDAMSRLRLKDAMLNLVIRDAVPKVAVEEGPCHSAMGEDLAVDEVALVLVRLENKTR